MMMNMRMMKKMKKMNDKELKDYNDKKENPFKESIYDRYAQKRYTPSYNNDNGDWDDIGTEDF